MKKIIVLLLLAVLANSAYAAVGSSCLILPCITANTECVDQVCQCKNGFSPNIGNTCDRVFDGDCSASGTPGLCSSLSNSACIDNKCTCITGYIPNGDVCGRVLDGDCSASGNPELCNSLSNSVCTENKCTCIAGYATNGDVCDKVLGGDCVINNDCSSKLPNTICNADKKCTCATGYLSNNLQTQCSKVLNAACPPQSVGGCEGTVPNSECKENLCSCKTGFAPIQEIRCALTVGGPCDNDGLCLTQLTNAVCSPTGTCVCNDGYSGSTIGTGCLRDVIFGGSCIDNSQCVANLGTDSICTTNRRCGCIENYHYAQDKCYQTIALNEVCTVDAECQSQANPENYACINNKCSCIKGYLPSTNNDQICVKSALGEVCSGNSECQSVTNSECIGNRCTCSSGFTPNAMEIQCNKVLGGDCVINTDCSSKLPNTICNAADTKCTCETGYLSNNLETQCSKVLNAACPPQSAGGCSATVPNSECKNNLCSCSTGFVPDSQETLCLLTVGGPCDNDGLCRTQLSNSVCSPSGTCVCNDGYSGSTSGSRCLKDEIFGGSCIDNSQCVANLGTDSVCTTNQRCGCIENYHYAQDKCYQTIALNEACTVDAECQSQANPENYACINNKCSCIKGYLPSTNNDQICVKSALGGDCSGNFDCRSVTNSECTGNKCTCSSGFTPNAMEIQCNRVLNEDCPSGTSEGCNAIVPNSECKNNKCTCKPFYAANPTATACLLTLGAPCVNDLSCSSTIGSDAICSDDKTCVCRLGYSPSESGTSCLMDVNLGDVCGEVTQCIKALGDNSTCAGTLIRRCQCLVGYHYAQEKCYITIPLNEDCRDDAECQSTTNPENYACLENKCKCSKGNFLDLDSRCVESVLGKECVRNLDCQSSIPDSMCSSEKKCVCASGFAINDLETQCNKVLGGDCARNSDCQNGVQNSFCSSQKKCECSTGYLANNLETQCNKVLNGACPLGGCNGAVTNSECKEGKCTCLPGYIANSQEIRCLLTVGGPCVDDPSCQSLGSAVCTDANTCICNNGYSASTSQTSCLIDANYGGFCTDASQCVAAIGTNSTCKPIPNRRCDCLTNCHYAQGKCYLTIGINEACRDGAECQSLENPDNYACIENKCTCSAGHVPDENNDKICVNSAGRNAVTLMTIFISAFFIVISRFNNV